MSKSKVFLIDATGFCYRAFYALKGLATSYGQPTGAILGFVNMLNRILKEENPRYLGACFDVSRDTFRQKRFAAYKIKRPPMSEELTSQMPIIKEILSAYGIAVFEKAGFEADDIIATLSHYLQKQGLEICIVSCDKDILQLINENISVFSPYREAGTIYDRHQVLKRYGIEPFQMIDLISLMGDSVDNIPGVKGIGEKTARELINKFGSLDNLLNNVENLESARLRQLIKDNIESINLSRQLASLDDNVPLEVELDALRIRPANNHRLYEIFSRLEFRKLLKELPQESEEVSSGVTFMCAGCLRQEDIGQLKEVFVAYELHRAQRKLNRLFIATTERFFESQGLTSQVRLILSDNRIKKIGHNLKDLSFALNREGVKLTGIYFDTMLAAYLLNPSGINYNLVHIARQLLRKCPFPKEGDKAGELRLLVELKPLLENLLKDKSLYQLFCEIEIPLIQVLADMEYSGIKLDTDTLKGLSKDLQQRLINLIDEIYRLSGGPFNINSPKQLAQILFVKLKLPVIKKTKTGPSTNEQVLRELAGKHKLPALLLAYRQITKLKSTYIDTLPSLIDSSSGRIHPSFEQTTTETGRLSCRSPNLQNIPARGDIAGQIRRSIVAFEKDDCLVSADYSQIELRILAHLCADRALIEAFNRGEDIHKLTAALLYGVDVNAVNEKMREVAKRINFGIVYGLSPFGLSQDLNIAVEEAQVFIETYFVRYPGIKEYLESQIKKARKQGFVCTILGRKRYLPAINEKSQSLRNFAQRQAVNTPIQGSAADLIKLAMINIHRRLEQNRLKTRMIIQIHDELVFNVPEEELSQVIPLIRQEMENVMELAVPLKVNIKQGKNWLEMAPLA
jgi:DNA polymerase-1